MTIFCAYDHTIYRVIERLGSGNFGNVESGLWHSPVGTMQVAVKLLKEDAMESGRVKFLQEAAIMGQFHHRNVVKLMGVVTVGEPVSGEEEEGGGGGVEEEEEGWHRVYSVVICESGHCT